MYTHYSSSCFLLSGINRLETESPTSTKHTWAISNPKRCFFVASRLPLVSTFVDLRFVPRTSKTLTLVPLLAMSVMPWLVTYRSLGRTDNCNFSTSDTLKCRVFLVQLLFPNSFPIPCVRTRISLIRRPRPSRICIAHVCTCSQVT